MSKGHRQPSSINSSFIIAKHDATRFKEVQRLTLKFSVDMANKPQSYRFRKLQFSLMESFMTFQMVLRPYVQKLAIAMAIYQ